jgi:hypothetical protein
MRQRGEAAAAIINFFGRGRGFLSRSAWASRRCRAGGGGRPRRVLIGAIAGLLPALRAARMQPTEALRTV